MITEIMRKQFHRENIMDEKFITNRFIIKQQILRYEAFIRDAKEHLEQIEKDTFRKVLPSYKQDNISIEQARKAVIEIKNLK